MLSLPFLLSVLYHTSRRGGRKIQQYYQVANDCFCCSCYHRSRTSTHPALGLLPAGTHGPLVISMVNQHSEGHSYQYKCNRPGLCATQIRCTVTLTYYEGRDWAI